MLRNVPTPFASPKKGKPFVLGIFLFSLLLLFPFLFQAQGPDTLHRWYLRGGIHGGYIMQHRKSMGHLILGHIAGAELNLSVPTRGDFAYEKKNHYFSKGLGLHYFNLANPQQLGNMWAMSAFYDIPLQKKWAPSGLVFRLGLGTAYLTRHFDPITNHKNNAIGSAVNAFVNFRFQYRYVFSCQQALDIGLNFAHASNGKYQMPNLGLNVISINAGYALPVGQYKGKIKPHPDSTSEISKRHVMVIQLGAGINEADVPLGAKYGAFSLITAWQYINQSGNSWVAGIDLFNGGRTQRLLYLSGLENNFLQSTQCGIKAGYAYTMGPVSFPLEMGYYVFSRYTGDGMFYHRFGLRYQSEHKLNFQFSIKSHWIVASYFEWCLGYRLMKKQKS